MIDWVPMRITRFLSCQTSPCKRDAIRHVATQFIIIEMQRKRSHIFNCGYNCWRNYVIKSHAMSSPSTSVFSWLKDFFLPGPRTSFEIIMFVNSLNFNFVILACNATKNRKNIRCQVRMKNSDECCVIIAKHFPGSIMINDVL